jgi:hypothetical protein
MAGRPPHGRPSLIRFLGFPVVWAGCYVALLLPVCCSFLFLPSLLLLLSDYACVFACHEFCFLLYDKWPGCVKDAGNASFF